MTGGFVGTPPPPDGLWADTQTEARDLYQANVGTHGYPVRVGGRWLIPRVIRAVHERYAAQASTQFLLRGQPVMPARDWRKAKGALLPHGQAFGYYLAHRGQGAQLPVHFDAEFSLVPFTDGKPREVKPLRDKPMTTPHKGSAAEAARLHQWDKGRISERVSRRRRDHDRDDDDDQPEQATLFG